MRLPRSLSLGFAAGAVGGLLCGLVMWFCGEIGIADHYHVQIRPQLTLPWIYSRVVWGGLYGFLFALPFMEDSYFLRGLVYSAIPSLVTLFILFPIFQHKGIMGARLGDLAWVAVVGYNTVWGLSAGLWLKAADGR